MVEAPGESGKCFLRLTFPWTLALIPTPRQWLCPHQSPQCPEGSSRWYQGSTRRGFLWQLHKTHRKREGSIVCWHMNCSRHFTDTPISLGL